MERSLLETLQSQPSWVLVCLSLGTLSTFRFFISILQLVYIFLLSSKNLIDYGQWAIVTGPTDGIGKAMAFELARRGLNLVLVGRNPDKLSRASSEMKAEVPGVELKTVVIDLSGDLSEGIRNLKDVIKEIDVGILVNNAGLSQKKPMFFHEIDEEMWGKIVRVNLVAPTVVTAAVLPSMLQRRRGAIINIGSGSTVIPSFPLYAVYTGTKGYISSLSKSLHAEYKQSGIHAQCQIPFYVVTNITPTLRPSFFIATPSQYACSAIRCIRYGPECIPYWSHFILYYLVQLSPADCIVNRVLLRSALQKRMSNIYGKKVESLS
ncbi:unnamed protein product [Spirodela intermedia]|uniref:Uncharacterized protein n=2 Tax=Spirodela intermedia TaxID=51605 RepID=A0A7I8L560_SPIIN|nr:unnamed protein product [Spirodela intermedia]CAA7405080.1 unnamed protein product [Spirodela intermedia]CAA7405082.1 unnamed protein product [Spirodela intermedia]